MIKVICYFRPEVGFDMNEEYVYRLQAAVARFLPMPHNFVCLTPLTLPHVQCITPQYNWPGFWGKMEVFWHATDELNLYLDLDTMPVNDLRPILTRVMTAPAGSLIGSEDRMAKGCLNSSVMAWRGGLQYMTMQFERAWRHDQKGTRERYCRTLERYGDQGFIHDHLLSHPIFLGNLACSYKLDSTDDKQSASVVFFHGSPRPHQVGWMPW